jgi:hypothetical protein
MVLCVNGIFGGAKVGATYAVFPAHKKNFTNFGDKEVYMRYICSPKNPNLIGQRESHNNHLHKY